MLRNPFLRYKLASHPQEVNFMIISVLYVRSSTVEQRTDRQRVNEGDFDKVIEDKCSGSIPIFERQGGKYLKRLIEQGVVRSISVWQIDRCGRDLRDIINFIHFCTQLKVPIQFISQGLCTLNEKGEENPIAKMMISILGVVAEMERKLIRERQLEGIALAKLKGGVFTGRKKGTHEDPLKFLSKPKCKRALELLKKGYKGTEVAKITGLNVNTVSKVKRLQNAL